MDLHQLPDLSHWLYIEVWTIEEAAMIWAAIDPMEHQNTLLQELRQIVPNDQFKKAWSMQRAIAEAVCGGTLPFVEAYEQHEDYQNGPWDKLVDFPELPNHALIIHHKSRIKQAAFRKWADSKKILSFRQHIQQSSVNQLRTINAAPSVIESPTTVQPQPQVLALAAPSYLDTSHPRYAAKLHAAIRAWESAPEPPPGRTPKQGLEQWLTDHAVEYGLTKPDGSINKTAIEEASTIANWQTKGGSPRTP